MRFADRHHAGRLLGAAVRRRLDADGVVVLGLPRGGVPVAAEVARALGAPVDVLGVRKLGLPSQPELAVGAIGEGDVRVVDADLVARTRISARALADVEARERRELDRQLARYRGDAPPTPVSGRTVVVVDDGIATGSTALAAVRVVRTRGARRIVVAAPVAPRDLDPRLLVAADDVVVLIQPPGFRAVGEWYDDFAATGDDEVLATLTTFRRDDA